MKQSIPPWTLAITCRCLVDDLGFSADDCWRPVSDLVADNDVVAAFDHMRGQQPAGGELIKSLSPKLTAYSLHAGRFRGATWHQTKAGIVWLLAAGWHEQGSKADAYAHFERLWESGQLTPTRNDVERVVAMRRPTFERALLDQVPRMRREAIDHPAQVIGHEIGGRVGVRVACENGDNGILYIAISNRLLPGEMPLPIEWQIQVLAAFFLDISLANVEVIGEIAGQLARADEIVYCALIDLAQQPGNVKAP